MKEIKTLPENNGMRKMTQFLKSAILLSFKKACERKAKEISIEDLFLALIFEKKNIASRLMGKMGMDLENTILELEKKKKSKGFSSTIPIPSVMFRNVLSNAYLEANELNHVYVGTEHVLLAILKMSSNKLISDLDKVGINYKGAKQQLLIFGTYQPGLFSHANEDMKKGTGEPPGNLGYFARDMNKLASEGKYLKVWGREDEIDRVIHILSRRTKNNPILVGEAGVGKTAIVEGLVQRIESNKVPLSFRNKKIMQLDLASVIAGSRIRGDVEDRILSIINEISSDPDKILFIDEVHMVVGAGSAGQGSMDIANILKPHLTSGDLRVIGATTYDEYQKFFEQDDALSRRFQPVTVNEISKEDARQILKVLQKGFSQFHNINISEEAIEEAIDLSDRYIMNRYYPDKAIDIIDEAAASKKIMKEDSKGGSEELIGEIEKLIIKKNKALKKGKIEDAVLLLKKERSLIDKLQKTKSRKNRKSRMNTVSAEDVRRVVSNWTQIPVNTMTNKDINFLKKLDKNIKTKIIGQDKAVSVVTSALKRARIGIMDEKRPLASFLFLGPSGVGKTEFAKIIAKEVYGNDDSLIQIDMSEYMEQHSVSKLIGSPPGYVGFQEGGQLTEKIRRNPYSIVLFDEIEKAHHDLLNILLQIMEEGHLQDSKGRKVNFKNTIIILTSNIGAEQIGKDSVLGFNIDERKSKAKGQEVEVAYERMKETLTTELKETLPPEFLNRLDNIVIFRGLDEGDIRQIVKLQIQKLNERLSRKNIELSFSSNVINKIANEGFDEEYGARNIRRKVQELVENPLADLILEKKKIKNEQKVKIIVDLEKDNIKFFIK